MWLPKPVEMQGGKVPVRRDMLMMCVSAGKSVGEIACVMFNKATC